MSYFKSKIPTPRDVRFMVLDLSEICSGVADNKGNLLEVFKSGRHDYVGLTVEHKHRALQMCRKLNAQTTKTKKTKTPQMAAVASRV